MEGCVCQLQTEMASRNWGDHVGNISSSFKLNPQRKGRRESCIFRVDTAKDSLKLSDLLAGDDIQTTSWGHSIG